MQKTTYKQEWLRSAKCHPMIVRRRVTQNQTVDSVTMCILGCFVIYSVAVFLLQNFTMIASMKQCNWMWLFVVLNTIHEEFLCKFYWNLHHC